MTPIRHQVSRKDVLILFWTVVMLAVVISTGSLVIARQANTNSDQTEKAICVQIRYLEGVAHTTKALADRTGDPNDRQIRLRGAEGAQKLADDLRGLGITCPPD